MRRADVLVVGGGPAGCAAATFLATRGHEVSIVTRPIPPAIWLSESIPASALKLLASVGALGALETGGFIANEGNTVWWAGGAERAERFPPDQTGFHADRGRLESAFLAVARNAGVEVLTDGPVLSVDAESDGWVVRTGGAAHRGRWVLDASGRAGVVARRGLRLRERETTTLALVGHWATAGGQTPEPGCTLVESYDDGWAWSVPREDGSRCVTAMVDPRRTRLKRELGLAGMMRTEIGKATRLTDRLGAGRWIGPTRACPASPYGASRFTLPGGLLIGDAGSFIDPLSSYGVKKALASAWLGGVVVHTALTENAMTGPATELFDAREREVLTTYRARSSSFLREARDAHRHPFWDARLEAAGSPGRDAAAGHRPEGAGGGTDGAFADPVSHVEPGGRPLAEQEAEAFVASAAVRAAYDEIRALPSVDLRRGVALREVRQAAVVGDRIALEPHLASDRLPAGVRFVRHVDLRRVVRVAPGREQVPDIYDAYNAGGQSVELTDFLAALAVAVGAGFLDLA